VAVFRLRRKAGGDARPTHKNNAPKLAAMPAALSPLPLSRERGTGPAPSNRLCLRSITSEMKKNFSRHLAGCKFQQIKYREKLSIDAIDIIKVTATQLSLLTLTM
jgi:hypothetical protein